MGKTKFKILLIVTLVFYVFNVEDILSANLNITCPDDYRDTWQQPENIMDTIGVKQGMVIGEAGAGEGYFTFKLSKRVGNKGKIYANDIDEDALGKLIDRCDEEGISNIETIVGETENPLFPVGILDMVIMVYVFHDLEEPVKFIENIRPSLKPGANVVIVDRDPDKYGGQYDHFLKKDQVVDKVKKSGYELIRVATFLPRDNIYILKLSD